MNAPEPKLNAEARHERDLFRIMMVSTALGFGALAAFLYSLRDLKNDVSFVFSTGTVVMFLLGAFAGWAFWAVLRRLMKQGSKKPD